MFTAISDMTLVACIGLFGGVLLGLAARLGRFCTLGAIEDALYGNSDTRLRMWGVAIGTAIIGSFALMGLGYLDASSTIYLGLVWSPLASILGGLLFGYGMALSGNCGFGALARLGGGDMRSFVIVLVMGLAAYVTISGPLAYIRVWAFPVDPNPEHIPGIAHALERATGISSVAIGLLIGAAILGLSFYRGALLTHRKSLFWAAMVGIAIISGWAGTHWVASNSFEPVRVVSHTFSAPIGETMLYAMTASGNSLSFGVGSVVGVLVGAFIGSLIKGHFRWEACEDPRELQRQIGGACLMGVGAVLAIGCSIGQGLSAFSLLAFSAPVTFAAIFAGAAFGLRQLIAGFSPAT